MATKCAMCRSLTCDKDAATIAKDAANKAFAAAVLSRTNRATLYHDLKAAEARYETAWDLCIAASSEHNRQMDVFIAALKVYVTKSTYIIGCAVSEGVRRSMLPGRFGATMLCMRGAR